MKKLHVIVLTNGLEIMKLLNIIKGIIVNIHLLIFIRHKDIIPLVICFKMFQKISKTHYSTKTGFYNNKIRKKKFEDFNYRDLQMGRSKSDLGQKEEKQFKKINEVGDGPKQEEQQKEEEEKKDNEDQKKVEENN